MSKNKPVKIARIISEGKDSSGRTTQMVTTEPTEKLPSRTRHLINYRDKEGRRYVR